MENCSEIVKRACSFNRYLRVGCASTALLLAISIKSLDFWTKLQSFFTSVSLQNNVNCSLAQRTLWRPHFANAAAAVSSLLFWSPASGSGFGGLCSRSASVLYYYVLLSRFLTIHPYSRAEVLLTFLAYINRKSFWLLSDEDKAV